MVALAEAAGLLGSVSEHVAVPTDKGANARATTATIRRRIFNIPARIATSARRITLHLPTT